MKIPSNITHVVVYLGAPYGENEGGHVVSHHKTRKAAIRAWNAAGEIAHRNQRVVGLDDAKAGPRWVAGPFKTPREYFNN